MALAEIQRIARKMLYDDAGRDKAFLAYMQMDHNGWDLPEQIRKLPWIRKVISSDPGDAISTGVRILSTLPLSLRYQALATGQANKDKANMIENVLDWELRRANRRRSKAVQAEVVKSALLYDAVAVRVIDLEYAIKAKQLINASSKREKIARRYSRFLIETFNPRDVHVRYSGIMPEAVLLVQTRHAADIIDEWGDKARALPELVALAANEQDDWVTYYDYTDYEQRGVWLSPGTLTSIDQGTEHSSMVLVGGEENPVPFLNWVAMMGGSTMDAAPEHRYRPLLYPIWTTGAWDIENIVKTLMVSETIAHSGSPRYVDEGPNVASAKIDFMSPERMAKPAAGNTVRSLEPPGLDAAMAQVEAMMSTQIDKATLNRILQGGQLPAGIAFATLNLATQTAVGALKPAKDLSEKALAEMFTVMLLWVNYTRRPLHAYSRKKEDYGNEMVVEPDDVDPEAIYIDTELHPDAPTDRQQRVNTASLAVQQLKLPVEQALEEIGVTDPPTAVRNRYKEMLQDHQIELLMRKNMLELEAAIQVQTQQQMMAIQQQAAMMQQQMAMAQATPAPEGEAGGGGLEAMLQPGPRGVPRGEAVNPNGGGEPPAFFNSEETRELVRGTDFLGNEAGVI